MPELDTSAKMLVTLARLGLSRHVLRGLYDMSPDAKHPTDTLRYTFGPLVYHSLYRGVPDGAGGWLTPDIIERDMPLILEERLEILLGLLPGHRISPTEIVLVMHNATMAAPLQHEAAEMYLWAGNHAIRRRMRGEPEEEIAARLVECHASDRDFLEPNGRYHMGYCSLAAEIRRKVVAHDKTRREAAIKAAPKRKAAAKAA